MSWLFRLFRPGVWMDWGWEWVTTSVAVAVPSLAGVAGSDGMGMEETHAIVISFPSPAPGCRLQTGLASGWVCQRFDFQDGTPGSYCATSFAAASSPANWRDVGSWQGLC